MAPKNINPGSRLDQAALVLSGVCLLHCLALPLLLAGIPLLGTSGEQHFHLQMLALVLPVSLLAFALGFRRHGSLRVLCCGAFGLILLGAGATIVHSRYGLTADTAFTVAGALILGGAHYFNGRLGRHPARATAADVA